MRALTTTVFLVTLTAGAAVAQPVPQAPDRSSPPRPGPAPRLTLPPVQAHKLANGLPVWIVERHRVPTVTLVLVVKSGSAADPTGQFGLASLTAAMLTEGAGGRDALTLADEVDFLGADLESSSSFDASTVTLHVPVARLAQAMPLMADVATRPDFPRAELDRLRERRLTGLRTARDSPPQIASLAFPLVVFGDAHRYGTSALGTSASLRGFTVDQLREFHATHYRPDNAALIVAGDVTAATLLPLLEKHLAGWRAAAGSSAGPALPAPAPLTARAVTLVDKPGAAQSVVRIGGVGVPRDTPDYFALEVMNTILGGSFTSRLNQNLREEHGYAYGAASSFDMRRLAGPFFAGANVQTDKTAESVSEILKELDGIRREVPPDELAKARNYLAFKFPGDFETNADVADAFADLVVYGLPMGYYDSYVERIQSVTAADVQRVASKHIQPDRLAVVVVGDRQAVETKLGALGLGTPRVLAVDQVVR